MDHLIYSLILNMNTTLHIRTAGEDAGNVKGAASSLPKVFSGQRLYGSLDVSTLAGNAPVFDTAEIVFEGMHIRGPFPKELTR